MTVEREEAAADATPLASEEETGAAAAAAPSVEPSERPRGQRKVRTGVVVSDKMDKTVVIRIEQSVRHPVYHKTIRRTAKLTAHDEKGDAHVGDTVRVMETRPLSKTKRWRVIEVVERAK
jgi:small subunit ribosomal protein S17